MENSNALRILRELVNGRNPFTGNVIPTESVFQQPETNRALEKAIAALQSDAGRIARKKDLFAKFAKPLASDEDQLCLFG
ncbi:MAG: hypothetical protein WBC78_17795 [Candidatus Sulfotelmatobacter sp.]